MKTAVVSPAASAASATGSRAATSRAPLLVALSLLVFASPALAFPPCPRAPLNLVPVEGEASEAEPWYEAQYAIVGDPNLIEAIASSESNSQDNPYSGKCSDSSTVPVPAPNASTGAIGVSPSYAPISAFAAIALPDWSAATPKKRVAVYTFDFAVDDTPLPSGAWIDLLQLELRSGSGEQTQGMQIQTGTFYRLRKLSTYRFPAALALIESRPSDSIEKPRIDRIVALMPMEDISGATTVRLRWTQTVAIVAPTRIDTTVAFFDDGKLPIYEAKLENQWADVLSMGLLDYNLDAMPQAAPSPQLIFRKMELSAE